jgi:hypothetical protein
MQNINAFLEAARKFGLKEADLFTADQLYYASDFQKVITCISTLSSSSQCKGAGECSHARLCPVDPDCILFLLLCFGYS